VEEDGGGAMLDVCQLYHRVYFYDIFICFCFDQFEAVIPPSPPTKLKLHRTTLTRLITLIDLG
jgi:hypothetical protein